MITLQRREAYRRATKRAASGAMLFLISSLVATLLADHYSGELYAWLVILSITTFIGSGILFILAWVHYYDSNAEQ